MSYLDRCTDAQVVKGYSNLMMTCDPQLGKLMAMVPVDKDAIDLSLIAGAIRKWCLEDVKPLEGSIFPSSVELNVENRLSITDVDDTDTVEGLVAAFHKAIKWNTPAK